MVLPESWWLFVSCVALLALTAMYGYRFGRSRAPARKNPLDDRPEIQRALSVVGELEGVAGRLRKSLSQFGRGVRKFTARLLRYENRPVVSRHELCDRAEEMLKPTVRLSADIARAYDQLVQQMTHLSTFAELRTDPLTGADNRRALDEKLTALLAEQTRRSTGLSLAMVDIDFFKQVNDTHNLLQGDHVLKYLAGVLRSAIRPCDVLARYGGEEFVIVMPHTELCVAAELAERIRATVLSKMSITVSIGLAASAHGDTPATLFSRVDAALASAKAAGRNCVFLHEGTAGHIVGINERPHARLGPQRPAPQANDSPPTDTSASEQPRGGPALFQSAR